MAYEFVDEPPSQYEFIDEPLKQGSGNALLDAGNAVGTGFHTGLLRLAGLPVDTVANIRDLAKAGAGSLYQATTGKVAPNFLQIGDRSEDVGSGDNLIKNARKTTAGQVLTVPANPEFQGGYSEAIGGGLTGVINPISARQAINQGVLSVGGAIAGKGVYDNTGNNALAIAAGMSPTAGQSVLASGTKRLVRGGESGRKVMEQRIQDLKNAGVKNPTLGIASGNSTIGALENILQSTPGAVNIMTKARDGAIGGLEGTVTNAAELASKNRGSIASGQSIQRGAKTFRDNFKSTQGGLYGNLDNFIAPTAPVDISSTRGAMRSLNAEIPTMPALSKRFMNGQILGIEKDLNTDMRGTPSKMTVINIPQRVVMGRDAVGMPIYENVDFPVYSQTPAIPDRTAAPWQAVKQFRTLVGNEIADTNLASSVPRSKWNPLYGALSGDMQSAATASGPAATSAFNRANNFTRAGISRLDAIDPIVGRNTPEDTYHALQSSLKDNTTAFQAVKKSLPEGARGDFAGTVIENLGKSTPGQQDYTGEKFSPETFLTNWNKMSDGGKTELLSGFPNAKQVRADVEAVAKATSMMRDSSKILANPSGTAAKSAGIGYLGLLGGAAGSLNLGLLGSALSLPVAANLAAKAVNSPMVRNSMASKTSIDPRILNAQINGLIGGGLLNEPK